MIKILDLNDKLIRNMNQLSLDSWNMYFFEAFTRWWWHGGIYVYRVWIFSKFSTFPGGLVYGMRRLIHSL